MKGTCPAACVRIDIPAKGWIVVLRDGSINAAIDRHINACGDVGAAKTTIKSPLKFMKTFYKDTTNKWR